MSDGRIIERTSEGFTFRYFESATGTQYTHYDCERRLKAAMSAIERWFSRALRTRTTSDDPELDRQQLRDLWYEADALAEYVAVIQVEIDRLEGVDRKTERITALRMVEGRTQEEAALFLAKANQLEEDVQIH